MRSEGVETFQSGVERGSVGLVIGVIALLLDLAPVEDPALTLRVLCLLL